MAQAKGCHCAARHRGGDLLLHGEEVLRRSLVLLRPDMTLRTRVDQLCGDSQFTADSSEAGLEKILNAELASDLVDALRRGLVMHRRRARDDSEVCGVSRAHLRDHFLGQPVTEILLLRIAGEVLEGKHGEHDAAASASVGPRSRENVCNVADSGHQRRQGQSERHPATDMRWRGDLRLFDGAGLADLGRGT